MSCRRRSAAAAAIREYLKVRRSAQQIAKDLGCCQELLAEKAADLTGLLEDLKVHQRNYECAVQERDDIAANHERLNHAHTSMLTEDVVLRDQVALLTQELNQARCERDEAQTQHQKDCDQLRRQRDAAEKELARLTALNPVSVATTITRKPVKKAKTLK